MKYNDLDNDPYNGLTSFINDLNTRFENLLFKDIENYEANYLGLARLDINSLPLALNSNGDYDDALFDDNYSLVSCFIDSAARNDGSDSRIDLLVSVNMDKFTGYSQEGIMNEVFQVMKVTSFDIEETTTHLAALRGVVYDNLIPDSMSSTFVFKISSKSLVSFN